MRKFTPYFFTLVLAIAFLVNGYAQVTTSSLTGVVKSGAGEGLPGATVKAIHTPTGTTYTTVAGKDGVYNIVNMNPGGPYTVDVSYVGYTSFSQSNINLSLGEAFRIDANLATSGSTLQDIVVTAAAGNNRKKTGASTNISRAQINALPTLSRSIQDYTRLTPQANGNSFGGASNRFNNITIDGAVNNDVFGLSGSGTPGGSAGTTPISLDAIQDIQVALAPYDVVYGNFTGAGINAVTRSGTNNFEGSVYYFFRNQGTVGSDPVTKVKTTDFTDKQYGIRFGGPIIKNKLFFFVNGELARRTAPTINNAGDQGAVLTGDEAVTLTNYLKTTYNYDPGVFNAFDAETQSDKVFARIDWNINDKHQLTLRHNYIKAYDDNISRTGTLFRFGNNTYRFNNEQNITVAELRSRFSNKVSNNLIIGVHRIRDFRSTYGSLFPSVEITQNVTGLIQFGSERSSVANELDQDIFEITDNVKLFQGRHTITIGTHNEFFKFRNQFINNFNGRWRFNSLTDFYNNNPRQLEVTYSANKDANAKPAAEFNAAQLGFYVQDEFQVTQKLKLTYGLRVDLPTIGSDPAFNPAVDTTWKGKYSTSNKPTGNLLWSPRVGFNYDVKGNRSLIVRGGVGIFSGRSPFVWISNQFGGTGVMFRTISVTDNTTLTPTFNEVNNNNGFNPDPNAQGSLGSAGSSFEVNMMSKDFKLPQVLRGNLGVDFKLPGGINATFEGIYSKTLNNVFYEDVNLKPQDAVTDQTWYNGADKRTAFNASSTTRRYNTSITNAILLSNTNDGFTYNLGLTLNKTLGHLFVQGAYNYNRAKDVNSGANSTALSNWEFIQVVGNSNNPPLATSNYELRHRITGIVSYNIEYLNHMKTSIALFYTGNSGQVFTYLTNVDLNNDGRTGNDLLYVPNDPSQIKFVSFQNTNGSIRYTAQEQSDAFFAHLNRDEYLKDKKGGYTERNGRSTPWEHVIDARIAQDFFVNAGGKKHAVQVTFDVFNLTNLLNRDWGHQFSITNQAYVLLSSVNRNTGPADDRKGFNYNPAQKPWTLNFASRWQGQIGLRYSFN